MSNTSIKNNRIINVLMQVENTGADYDITGFDLNTLIIFYREKANQFDVMNYADYDIIIDGGKKTLVITNLDLLSRIEEFQFCVEYLDTSNKYDPVEYVDIEILLIEYNKLVDSFKGVKEYILDHLQISDTLQQTKVMPRLENDQIWSYKAETNEFIAIQVQDFDKEIERLLAIIRNETYNVLIPYQESNSDDNIALQDTNSDTNIVEQIDNKDSNIVDQTSNKILNINLQDSNRVDNIILQTDNINTHVETVSKQDIDDYTESTLSTIMLYFIQGSAREPTNATDIADVTDAYGIDNYIIRDGQAPLTSRPNGIVDGTTFLANEEFITTVGGSLVTVTAGDYFTWYSTRWYHSSITQLSGVSSVNGKIGIIVLNTDDIENTGNLGSDKTTRNNTQGRALNWEQLDINDDDMLGMDSISAVAYLLEKLLVGQETTVFTSTNSTSNFLIAFGLPEGEQYYDFAIKRSSSDILKFEIMSHRNKTIIKRAFHVQGGLNHDTGYYKMASEHYLDVELNKKSNTADDWKIDQKYIGSENEEMDLNDIVEDGWYKSVYSANLWLNVPEGTGAFTLRVDGISEVHRTQHFSPHSSSVQYIRRSNDNGAIWSAWEKIAVESYVNAEIARLEGLINTKLNLTGGTMTGALIGTTGSFTGDVTGFVGATIVRTVESLQIKIAELHIMKDKYIELSYNTTNLEAQISELEIELGVLNG